MLIVCPTCATSYMIDPASVGAAGRAVRCARCKATWFAGGPKSAPAVTAFVDRVIADAEAQSTESSSPSLPPSLPPSPTPRPADRAPDHAATAADHFGAEPDQPLSQPPLSAAPQIAAQRVEPVIRASDIVPQRHEQPEPVEFHEAPPLVPPIEHAPLPHAADAELDSEIENFSARRQRLKARRSQKRRSSRWTAIVLVLFAFNVALIGARGEVVRYLPQTASLFAAIGLPVNLRHLKFEDVRITKEAQDGVEVLIVHGAIVSTVAKPAAVPRLRFAARNASGQEVYTWTALPSRSILGAGERLEFSSRLAAPPADANDVMVRFFNEQDATAAAK